MSKFDSKCYLDRLQDFRMPAKGPVSIAWQIVFVVFIPIAGIWAFYRIKKLQKSIIYILLPAFGLVGLAMIPYMSAYENITADPVLAANPWVSNEAIIFEYIISAGSIALLIWEIYLIYRWSTQWNEQFANG